MQAGILWVDLSAGASRHVIADLRGLFRVRLVTQLRDVAVTVEQFRPVAICYEFKIPSSEQLFALRECKRLFPSVPILMITEAHSELLAVWALRARVWDYLVKPCSLHKINTLLHELEENIGASPRTSARRPWFPLESQEESLLRPALAGAQRVVTEAKLYVQANLSEKIIASEVAAHCGVSQFHFSRLFKRETGITFSDYLTKVRMNKAMEALQRPDCCIGDIAAELGFPDPSYFSRMFKRCTGLSPSEYAQAHRQMRLADGADPLRPLNAGDTEMRPFLRVPLR